MIKCLIIPRLFPHLVISFSLELQRVGHSPHSTLFNRAGTQTTNLMLGILSTGLLRPGPHGGIWKRPSGTKDTDNLLAMPFFPWITPSNCKGEVAFFNTKRWDRREEQTQSSLKHLVMTHKWWGLTGI